MKKVQEELAEQVNESQPVRATLEEVQRIQEMNSRFTQAKIAIADCELQKESILKHIEGLKVEFSVYEKDLVRKYGEGASINIQTGEITQKEK